MTLDLFQPPRTTTPESQVLCPGAVVLRQFAAARDESIVAACQAIAAAAPFRQMTTPGGFRMSVAMTNCGEWGWVTDRKGYRYNRFDPETGQLWPPMPELLLELATDAAASAGFPEFVPDACLINRYDPGARMSLHQDRNERDFSQPIISVSLGLPAIFLFGGATRADKPLRVSLEHGDIVIWGGPSRLRFHGILPLKGGQHVLLGMQRINLTFRKAG